MHARAQLSKTVFGTVCQHPAAKPGIFPSRSKNIRNLLVDGSRLFWLLYWKVRPVETPDFRASILKHNLSPSKKKKCRTSHHQSHRRTSWRDGTKKNLSYFSSSGRSRARPTWTWRSSTTTTQSLTHCLCNLTKRWAVFCRTSAICFEKKCPDFGVCNNNWYLEGCVRVCLFCIELVVFGKTMAQSGQYFDRRQPMWSSALELLSRFWWRAMAALQQWFKMGMEVT